MGFPPSWLPAGALVIVTKLWLDDAHITSCETAKTWKTVSLVETLVSLRGNKIINKKLN